MTTAFAIIVFVQIMENINFISHQNGYWSCEGTWCDEAYELYLDENETTENIVKYASMVKLANKEDVTYNAVDAVFQHLMGLEGFAENGFAGYEIPKKDIGETVTMAVFRNDTHVCVSKKLFEELKEYKAMYEDLCK